MQVDLTLSFEDFKRKKKGSPFLKGILYLDHLQKEAATSPLPWMSSLPGYPAVLPGPQIIVANFLE